jgi:phosphatidyl-myo-inositol dimannoside synthase
MPLRAKRKAKLDDGTIGDTDVAPESTRRAAGPGDALMKVLLISNDFPPTAWGVSRWFERICATVPPDCVLVLAPRVPGDLEFDAQQPYRIVRRRVPMSRHPLARVTQMLMLCAYAIGLARREQVGAIHVGQLHLAPIALVVKHLLKIPYVIYLFGGEMAPYMRLRPVRFVAGALMHQARTVVVCSTYIIRHFEALGIRIPRVEVLMMSVEIDRFHPAVEAHRTRARYGLNGQKVILTVARLDDYKGHDMVIQALSRVKQAAGPIRYLIVGRGREERKLRTLASNLGCSEEVIFAGYVPDGELPSVYAACDVFVMPSRPLPHGDFEGFGIVFLEAGACGKPVVGGRSGGIPEAVIDGVTGVLVDPTDVGEISEALTRLLLDELEATRLGTEGRRRTERLGSAYGAALTRIWGG